jgi:hypothetical protein
LIRDEKTKDFGLNNSGKIYHAKYPKGYFLLRSSFVFMSIYILYTNLLLAELIKMHLRGLVQKFPDWPPGARTANVTTLCH